MSDYMNHPDNSPWGKVQHGEALCAGVFEVSTASHGGIMMLRSVATKVLSIAARRCGVWTNGYLCFEEDCAACVALRELMDRGLFTAPVNERWKPGEYEESINKSIQYWHKSYWQAREKHLANEPMIGQTRIPDMER